MTPTVFTDSSAAQPSGQSVLSVPLSTLRWFSPAVASLLARHWPTQHCEWLWSWYRLIWIDLLSTDDDILVQLYTELWIN
ncbi:hypothetical protein Pcinc_012451 [Petrolisthes cinctipes]|uniref:Uncharacterized protein n=1 Tax=Petrolisthes cinctipes TaxID=88211 RepID=A0AAE1KSK2_PETCI|nr:hypothetical protein Pcinc_012451 [Petrolisthes cinctipes]